MPIISNLKGGFSRKLWNLTFQRKWETNDTNCSGGGKHSCNRPHAHKLSLIKLILQFWTGLFFTFDILFSISIKAFQCSYKIMHQKLPFTPFSSLSGIFKIFVAEEKLYQSFLMLLLAGCTAVTFVLSLEICKIKLKKLRSNQWSKKVPFPSFMHCVT